MDSAKRSRDAEGEVPVTNGQAGESDEGDVGPQLPVPQSDGEDDIGPVLPSAGATGPKKRRRVFAHESLFLDQLPSCDIYERSYMHRDVLNFVVVTRKDFIVTTSDDGHLKFWKKTMQGIEFVKHYRAHLASIVGINISADSELVATISEDKSVKVYDVTNFDMINMLKLDYMPSAVCWVHQPGKAQALLAISEKNNGKVHIYDGRGDGSVLHTLEHMHTKPVCLMSYNSKYNCVVSADEGGMMEYWEPEEPFGLPRAVGFKYKSETDLYDFKKSKAFPNSITFSPDGSLFVVMSMSDRQVRVFKFLTGKLFRKYDESLAIISEMQQAGTTVHKLDDMEFGRRLAVEKELEKSKQASTINAVFDESSNFVIYPTLIGIKMVNLHTNRVSRIVGTSENNRFLNLSLYQGAPRKKGFMTMAMAASDNVALKESEETDPTLFCTAYKRNRFYMFTRRDADSSDWNKGDRDVFNEKPSREEQTVATSTESKHLGTNAIIRTTAGDIHLRLFPDIAPKAVENFVTHARNGYYDNLIFHRVIKSFMIQTGDPFGDGTGGESIWGNDFQDEFHPDYRHDRPYTLSMANAGPNTNGSQFFITTVPTPWLDNKHTVFGRATAGMDVIHDIENAKVDNTDKPLEDIKMLNIEIR